MIPHPWFNYSQIVDRSSEPLDPLMGVSDLQTIAGVHQMRVVIAPIAFAEIARSPVPIGTDLLPTAWVETFKIVLAFRERFRASTVVWEVPDSITQLILGEIYFFVGHIEK